MEQDPLSLLLIVFYLGYRFSKHITKKIAFKLSHPIIQIALLFKRTRKHLTVHFGFRLM